MTIRPESNQSKQWQHNVVLSPADASFFHSLAVIRNSRSSFIKPKSSETQECTVNETALCCETLHYESTRDNASPLRRALSSDRYPRSDNPMLDILRIRSYDDHYTGKPHEDKDLSKVQKPAQSAKLPFPGASRTQPEYSGYAQTSTSARVPPSKHISENTRHHENQQLLVRGRRDYDLGDIARSPSHMIIDTSPQATCVSELNDHDFAFVNRSGGSWSYAILAHRHQSHDENKEYMVFVVDKMGSTKTIKKRQWAKCVRCVTAGGAQE
eukprot:scaffold27752_cov70-Cyclotella_meneghiniana.AAC.1